MKRFLRIWFKHATLNAGDLLRQLRFLTRGPDGMGRTRSVLYRSKKIVGDLWWGIILPPQSHHSSHDLDAIDQRSAWSWFWHELEAWDHPRKALVAR